MKVELTVLRSSTPSYEEDQDDTRGREETHGIETSYHSQDQKKEGK